MTESDIIQLAIGLLAAIAAGFGLLKRWYSYKIQTIIVTHKNELLIQQERKNLAQATHVSNGRALDRFEKNKAEIFERLDQFERRFEALDKKIGWLETIVPVTHDLLQKIHRHFEKQIGPASEVNQIGPSAYRVGERKKEK